MESKDQPYDSLAALRARVKCAPLQLDATKLEEPDALAVPESRASSYSASTKSPATPTAHTPTSATEPPPPPDSDGESTQEPASGPQRSRASSAGAAKGKDGKEKRKRSRVTPEQLAHLERFFATDRSPTAARRREISDVLGMQERQTQIWFQNRRAKAKLLDGKRHRSSIGDWSEPPPDTPPQLSPGFEAELQNLIHEDDPITIIPCTDLSIGTWRRIATASGNQDLAAYVSKTKRCLTWFIHSAGHGFKMEIPFDTITHTDYNHASPGQSLVSFNLSQPPTFYLENTQSPRMGGPIKSWQTCADWTEGMQASKVLRHNLIGSAVHLAHFLQDLRGQRSSSGVQLLTSPYNPRGEASASVQLPQPPLALLGGGDVYGGHATRPSFLGHGRKRSFSGPPAYTTTTMLNTHSLSPIDIGSRNLPLSATFPSAPYSDRAQRPISMQYSVNLSQSIASAFSTSSVLSSHSTGAHHQHQPSLSDYSNVPISHAVAPRPYTTTSTPTSHFFQFEQDRRAPAFELDVHPDAAESARTHFGTPSPPLLGLPFAAHADAALQHAQAADAAAVTSGLPAYHEELHSHDLDSSASNSLVGALGMATSPSPPDMHVPRAME